MGLSELIKESEIKFWDYAIHLLESEASTLTKFINVGYQSYQRYRLMNFIHKSFFWASIGLMFGLILGLFIA